MYADKITRSMQNTIDETHRRREKQLKYNEENNITPRQIEKATQSILRDKLEKQVPEAYEEPDQITVAADPVVQYMSREALEKNIEKTRKAMEKAAKDLDFIQAARYRDEMYELQKLLKEKV